MSRSLRNLVPDLEPVDGLEVLVRARASVVRRRVWAVSAGAVAVLVMGVGIAIQRQPDALPAETSSSQSPAAECPSTKPRTASSGMQPATSPFFYWNGVAYVDATVRPERGSARFVVRCEVTDAPAGQEWIEPWPDGAAAGIAHGSMVYRAAGRDDDCLLVAKPAAGGEWMAFRPSISVPGC